MILVTVTFTTKEDFLKVAKARKDVRITDIACCNTPQFDFKAQPTLGELMAENTFGEDVDMYDFDIDPDDAYEFLGLEEVKQ